MAESEDRMVVRALLAAQGIEIPEPDLAAIAAAYPALRARIATLHGVECGDDEPATVVRAREAGES